MNRDHLAELKSNELLRKRLARWMAQLCLRNTKLEELHPLLLRLLVDLEIYTPIC